MSQGPSQAASEREPVEDSLSALTYGSDTEITLKKKTVRKSPKSPKSPYTSSTGFHSKKPGASRLFKGTEHKHFEIPLVKTSRQIWCGSLKQGRRHLGPPRPDLDLGPSLCMTLPDGTPEYLKEALGMKKPKHGRSSGSGYLPGTPDYKEKEEMYDEIIELKKTLQSQKCEADRMKTKIRRLEEENNRKDKQIEQLLDSYRSSEFGSVRIEQKNDISLMINGLKQRILRLEQQCKEKDNTINKLQTDEKKTNMEEMRIALETYYEEIQRLQSLLAKSKTLQRESSSSESSQKEMFNAAALQLSSSIKTLEEENWKLKADLDHMLRGSLASSRTKNYAEWSKKRLIQWISKLEKKLAQLQNDMLQLSETSTSLSLIPSASAQRDQSVTKEPEHLCIVVKTLQREKAVLQDRLAVKEENIQKLTEKLVQLERTQDVDCRYAGIHAIEAPDQGQHGFQLPSQQSDPSVLLHPKGSSSIISLPSSPGHHQKEQAARIIQRWWKACKTKNPDLSCGPHFSQAAVEEAVKLIQSVFWARIAHIRTEEGSLLSRPGDEKTSSATYSGEEKPVWFPFKCSPLVFTSVPTMSSQTELQPSPLLSAEEVHSDDSDEIITVSPSPVKKVFPLDFNNMASRSLVYS